MGRIETDFSDKALFCENRHVIGLERMDRQLLIVGDVAIFNFCRLRCIKEGCFCVIEWSSPNLFDKDNINYLSDIPKPKSDNLLGVAGVARAGNKFAASIWVKHFSIHLGTFGTIEAASQAYNRAKEILSKQNIKDFCKLDLKSQKEILLKNKSEHFGTKTNTI